MEIRCIPSLNNILFSITVCVHLMFVCMSEVTPLTLKTTFVILFFLFFYTQTSYVPPYTHMHLYRHRHTHRVMSWGPQQVGTCPPEKPVHGDTPRPHHAHSFRSHASFFLCCIQTDSSTLRCFHASREHLCMIQ